ncbi:MAG: ATP-binding protein [Bacillota bacterium]
MASLSRYFGIKAKLVAVVTVIMLTAFFILGFNTYRKSRIMLEQERAARLRAEIEWWAHRSIVHRIENVRTLAAVIAALPETQAVYADAPVGEGREDTSARFLTAGKNLLESYPEIVSAVLVGSDRKEITRLKRTTEGFLAGFRSERDWQGTSCIEEALRLKRGVVAITDLHPHPAAEPDGRTLCAAAPVMIGYAVRGAVLIDADFGMMLRQSPAGIPDARVYLADRDGRVFYWARIEKGSITAGSAAGGSLRDVVPGLGALVESGDGYYNFTDARDLHGFTRIYFDRPRNERYFIMAYRIPREYVLNGVTGVATPFLATGVGVFLVSLFMVSLLAGAVTRPVLNLAMVADRVAKGDLSRDAGPMPGRDEIGGLYRSFNAMIAALRESKSREEEKKARLLEAAGQAAADVTCNLSASVTLDKLIHSLINIVNADCACLHLISSQGTEFFAAGEGTQKCEVLGRPGEKGIAEEILRSGHIVRSQGMEITAGSNGPLRPGILSFFGVPIFSEGQVIGALCIGNREKEITEADEAATRLLAAHAGVAFTNARLHEKAVAMAGDLERRVAERTKELREMNLELERANRLKSEFLATVSHELRTPLNTIIGFSDVLLSDTVPNMPEKAKEYIQDIMESGEHLLALINDILDLAKIEAGKEVLHLEEIPVENFLRSILILFREKAAKHGIQLELVVNGVTEWLLDGRKFKQILFNLLSNALKFTPDGGKVKVEALKVDNVLAVSVCDNGIGIRREDMPRLFKPFEQLDSSLARPYPGTGLGLAMVKKLTELHGGTVSVESEPGKGSCFTIRFPLLAGMHQDLS